MKFIVGTKQKMTQFFADDGHVFPATILKTEPVKVTQVKAGGKDGYSAIQIGYGAQKKERVNDAQIGHLKEISPVMGMKEFRVSEEEAKAQAVGNTIDISIFAPGDVVEVSAISKGKGFQGVVKRHGFGGGRRTHGQKHSEREPGAIGGGARAGGRVAKGMRMAGRMGGDRITVKNLKVLDVDTGSNTILISGAIPGRRGTLVEITSK